MLPTLSLVLAPEAETWQLGLYMVSGWLLFFSQYVVNQLFPLYLEPSSQITDIPYYSFTSLSVNGLIKTLTILGFYLFLPSVAIYSMQIGCCAISLLLITVFFCLLGFFNVPHSAIIYVSLVFRACFSVIHNFHLLFLLFISSLIFSDNDFARSFSSCLFGFFPVIILMLSSVPLLRAGPILLNFSYFSLAAIIAIIHWYFDKPNIKIPDFDTSAFRLCLFKNVDLIGLLLIFAYGFLTKVSLVLPYEQFKLALSPTSFSSFTRYFKFGQICALMVYSILRFTKFSSQQATSQYHTKGTPNALASRILSAFQFDFTFLLLGGFTCAALAFGPWVIFDADQIPIRCVGFFAGSSHAFISMYLPYFLSKFVNNQAEEQRAQFCLVGAFVAIFSGTLGNLFSLLKVHGSGDIFGIPSPPQEDLPITTTTTTTILPSTAVSTVVLEEDKNSDLQESSESMDDPEDVSLRVGLLPYSEPYPLHPHVSLQSITTKTTAIGDIYFWRLLVPLAFAIFSNALYNGSTKRNDDSEISKDSSSLPKA